MCDSKAAANDAHAIANGLPSPTVRHCFLAVKRVVLCRLIVICQMLFVRKYLS
jgi:hypothetical protein